MKLREEIRKLLNENFLNSNSMRALSWKDPFGTLMLHGKIETRTWNTNYRGLVLICISQRGYNDNEIANISGPHQFEIIKKIMNEYGDGYSMNGMAIAVGNLIHCRPMTPSDSNETFTEYNDGLYCHIYDDVRAIKPFPWKGSQGWKTVDPEIVKKIEIL